MPLLCEMIDNAIDVRIDPLVNQLVVAKEMTSGR
jgi:hypothetical protein